MSVASVSLSRVAGPMRRALASDFLRHGALVFGASMAANVLNYLFNFAISRRVGVEGFATLSSLVSGLLIIAIPGAILNLVIVKYAADYHSTGDSPRLWRLSQVLLKATSAIAVAMFCIGWLLRGPFTNFLHVANDSTITLTLAIMAVTFVTPSVRGILQGEQDFVRYSISTTAEVLLKAVLGVGMVYAGFGVLGAMEGWFCGSAFALAYTIWAVRKHRVPGTQHIRLSLDLRHAAKTTASIACATATMMLLSFLDVILVKHYYDAHQAGLYAAVNLTGKAVLFLVGFVPLVLLPKAVAAARQGRSPVPLLIQAAAVSGIMSAAALSIVGFMPVRVVGILAGHAFLSAAPYVLQYDFAMALLAGLSLVVNYKIALHRFDFLAPLAVILIGEIGAIALVHRSLWDVVHILIACNAVAILACSYRIGAKPQTMGPLETVVAPL